MVVAHQDGSVTRLDLKIGSQITRQIGGEPIKFLVDRSKWIIYLATQSEVIKLDHNLEILNQAPLEERPLDMARDPVSGDIFVLDIHGTFRSLSSDLDPQWTDTFSCESEKKESADKPSHSESKRGNDDSVEEQAIAGILRVNPGQALLAAYTKTLNSVCILKYRFNGTSENISLEYAPVAMSIDPVRNQLFISQVDMRQFMDFTGYLTVMDLPSGLSLTIPAEPFAGEMLVVNTLGKLIWANHDSITFFNLITRSQKAIYLGEAVTFAVDEEQKLIYAVFKENLKAQVAIIDGTAEHPIKIIPICEKSDPSNN